MYFSFSIVLSSLSAGFLCVKNGKTRGAFLCPQLITCIKVDPNRERLDETCAQKDEDDQKAATLFKLTDNRSGRGNRVGEVGPAKSADPVPNDGGVGGGRGEGGGGGEDAGDGDEVFVAGDVTVE